MKLYIVAAHDILKKNLNLNFPHNSLGTDGLLSAPPALSLEPEKESDLKPLVGLALLSESKLDLVGKPPLKLTEMALEDVQEEKIESPTLVEVEPLESLPAAFTLSESVLSSETKSLSKRGRPVKSSKNV